MFRIDALKNNLYSSIGADTTKKYLISFAAKSKLDIKKLFIFENKKFVCLKYERRFDKTGQHPIIEGEFYPVT